MSETESKGEIPEGIQKILRRFATLTPDMTRQALVQYANRLPPLPERFQTLDSEAFRVHECQTPVFIWTEVCAGRVQIHAWVAPEAPTVKGFVGILREAFHDATPSDVLSVEHDILRRLGLAEALGMQRMRGLHAVLSYIRAQVRRAAE